MGHKNRDQQKHQNNPADDGKTLVRESPSAGVGIGRLGRFEVRWVHTSQSSHSPGARASDKGQKASQRLVAEVVGSKAGPYLGIEENRMRGSMTLAIVLLGLAPAWSAAGTAAAEPQPARSERLPASVSTTVNARASEIDSDSDEQTEGEKEHRRPPSSHPASPEATTPAPQPVFIISCNASGCNDNQGNFLTRSGPQRLVGPKGISCQSMGGNWQCNPATQP